MSTCLKSDKADAPIEHVFPVSVVIYSTDQVVSDVRIGSAGDDPPGRPAPVYFAMFYTRAAVRIRTRISKALYAFAGLWPSTA
jgi:hypothetical protein